MSELISVIVPVYNAEKYLHRCIDSLLAQSHQDLEVILVDDGSTDSSPGICDEYSQRDNRIRVIHKNNGGVSSARNAGLDICAGQYIGFVDNDDYCISSMYEILYKNIKQSNSDLAVCCWQWQNESGDWTVAENPISNMDEGIYVGREFAKYLYRGGYANGLVCAVWNKLYQRRLFNELRFQGYIEDEEINDIILSQEVQLCFSQDILYVWCQNKDSLSSRPFHAKLYKMFDVLVRRITLFEDRDFIAETKRLYCNLYIEYWYRAIEAGIEPYINSKLFTQYRKESQVDAKNSLRFLLFDISPVLYQTILAWKHRLWICPSLA